MSLEREDIVRAARSLINEFGDEAEAEANRRLISSKKKNLNLVAGVWEKTIEIIPEIRADLPLTDNPASRIRKNSC